MNLKQIKLLSPLILLIISFPIHFIYNIFPNFITSIFFPVNESIWEHMKLLYTSILLSGFIEYILLNKYKILYSNLLLSTFIKSVLIIPIYLIIYIPFYIILKDNLIIAITIMFISILLVNLFGINIIDNYDIKNGKTIAIVGIIIMYIIMGIFTFYPPKNMLFYDTSTKSYGIKYDEHYAFSD